MIWDSHPGACTTLCSTILYVSSATSCHFLSEIVPVNVPVDVGMWGYGSVSLCDYSCVYPLLMCPVHKIDMIVGVCLCSLLIVFINKKNRGKRHSFGSHLSCFMYWPTTTRFGVMNTNINFVIMNWRIEMQPAEDDIGFDVEFLWSAVEKEIILAKSRKWY